MNCLNSTKMDTSYLTVQVELMRVVFIDRSD